MEFRLSREEEYESVRLLWAQAFGEEQPWTSWYFSRHYHPDKTWVGVDDGKVVAETHLLPYRLMLRGSWRQAAYFVGVCVEEELRGTGIGRELLASALAELKRTGVGIGILQPRWPDFYRKLGWDYCYSRRKYNMPVSEAYRMLPAVPPAMRWDPDEQAMAPILAELYAAFVQPRHGYALRGGEDWDNLLSGHRGEGGRVGVLYCDGVPSGYVLYNISGSALLVREMVWRDMWMVDAAWKFMLSQCRTAGVGTLEWDDPAGDAGSALFPGTTSEPFLMGRLIDFQSLLAAMEYPEELSVEMNLTVADSLVPGNQGSFRWSIRQGKGVLIPAPPDISSELSLDIGTMSRLIFGEYPVRDILAAGTCSACREEEVRILERIFPVCRNFISEYY